jgi:diguanylate cyclase (GGDEF)-like protein/PAS domain S-box-containing protein
MKLVGRRKTKEWRDVVLVTIISILFSLFTASIHLSERLYRYFSDLAPLVTEYVVNFIFLYLAGLLYITYHRWKRAEKKQQEMEDIISSISPDTLIVVDREKNIIMCNPSIQRMFGYDPDEVIDKKTDLLYFQEQSETEELQETDEIPEQEGYHMGFAEGERKDGGKMPLEIITGNLSTKNGAVLLLRDITDRREAEKALSSKETSLRTIVEKSIDGIFIIDKERIIRFLNPAAEIITGFTKDELIGKPFDYQLSLDKTIEMNITRKNKESATVEMHVVETDWEGEKVFLVTLHDITERKKMEIALRKSEQRYQELSVTDDLTGLYNLRYFYKQLSSEMERSIRFNHSLSILMLDIDNFKLYNDTHGHLEGDQVLVRLAKVIQRSIRTIDSACRYGGEEFIVILPETAGIQGVSIAERIRKEFKDESFFPSTGESVHVTVSIGVAQFKTGEETETFVKRADDNMYRGKKQGKDLVVYEQ